MWTLLTPDCLNCEVFCYGFSADNVAYMQQFVKHICKDLSNCSFTLLNIHHLASLTLPSLLSLLIHLLPSALPAPFPSLLARTVVMSWLFLDWFVPLYLLVSVLVLAGFGACLYFLEPGLQDAHKWSNKTIRHHPLVTSVNCGDDDSNALI